LYCSADARRQRRFAASEYTTARRLAAHRRADELTLSGNRRDVVNEDGLKARRRITPEGGFSAEEAKKCRASVASQKQRASVTGQKQRATTQRILPFLQEQPTGSGRDSEGGAGPGCSTDGAGAS